MKRIALLLNGRLANDGRVIKTIEVLSRTCLVDAYFQANTGEEAVFGKNVQLYPFQPKSGFWNKLLKHTFFYREFDFLYDMVLNSGQKYDYVYANDLPTLLPAVKLKQKIGANLIYDSHEIFIETLNQFFPKEAPPLKLLVFKVLLKIMQTSGKSAEKRMLKQVDHFLTVNGSLAKYFKQTYGVHEVKVMMNCPKLNPEGYKPIIDYRKEYKWGEDDIILIYQGLLNYGRGLPMMLDVVKALPEKYKLVILGDGSLKKDLEAQVERLGLGTRVKFLGRLPYDDLLSYTVAADIGLTFLETFNLSKQYASPNKLFEYMHVGLPVVCSDTIECRQVVGKYNIGMLTSNEEPAVVEKIIEISKEENQKKYKENCVEAAGFYNWENQSKVLLEVTSG